MKGDIVVGLDIGTTKVCTLVGEVTTDTGRVDVLGVGVAPSQGLRRGVVVDIEHTVRAIEESVEKAQRMAGAEIRSVVVGITGEHIASLNSRGVIAITHADREVTAEDVGRVVENSKVIVLPPDREIIHAIPRGYAIDGQNGIRSPVGMSGTRLEVETHIVTGATSFLRNVVTCVERAGLHVEDLVLEPLATGDAVLMDAERDMGVALVDIGGGTADVVIFRGGDIAYSVIVPVGGQYVTRDIAAGLRMTLEEAERVKLAHGLARVALAQPDDTFTYMQLGTEEMVSETVLTLAEIIEPRAMETFQLIRRELMRSEFSQLLPGGLVLSGGGAMLAGMRDLGKEVTGLPTRIGTPGGVGGLKDSVDTPSFATAVGLLRWAGRSRAGVARRETPDTWFGAVTQWLRRVLQSVSGR